MKILIILALLLFVMVIIAARFRRQILMGLQILQMFRRMRKRAKPAEEKIERNGNAKDEPLVRCERCGKWAPQSEVINLRSTTVYCSSACMERAVKLQSMVD